MKIEHDIKWIDSGREPQCPPDPRYPNGMDVDMSKGQRRVCVVKLPYPAKRCGYYVIRCASCWLAINVTTAGRADDPKSVTMPCKEAARARYEVRRQEARDRRVESGYAPNIRQRQGQGARRDRYAPITLPRMPWDN
jgi:hypothetical protein